VIKIKVEVPDSIDEYATLFAEFIVLMLHKLDKNSHKKTPTKESLPAIMDLLVEEIYEFEQQIEADKFNENSLMELADQANFSFLAFIALRLQGVKHGQSSANPDGTGRPAEHSEALGSDKD
jgi:hypothetical protein